MSAAERYAWPAQPETNRRYTIREYLEFDAQAEGRWEYLGGYIYPVGRPDLVNQLDPQFRAGASPAHYELNRVLSGLLFGRLPETCRAFANDARVYIPVTKGYVYPDVVIVCGKQEFDDPTAKLPSLTNPVVIVEILSDATGEYDRSGKFMRYASIEGLQHYVLVDSRKVLVEVFTRGDAGWLYTQASQPTDVVELTAVQCRLSVIELYANLDLPTVEATMPPDPTD